jgi:hypothetical protein
LSAALTKIDRLLRALRKAKLRLDASIVFFERERVLEAAREEARFEAARIKKKRREVVHEVRDSFGRA